LYIHAVTPRVLTTLDDFAHLHGTSDGGFTSPDAFANALAVADRVLAPAAPFHIHFSDISFANRNERAHLLYGQGRSEPSHLGRRWPSSIVRRR
jgi:endonuclease IV